MARSRSWQDADVARGEQAAQAVLADLRIGHPTETAIENIAWLRRALVIDVPLRGAQGRLARLGDHATISVSTSVTYDRRRRFVIAHELGHLEIHRHVNQIELCDESKIDERYDDATEREANAFASALLMPRALWEKRTDVNKPNLDVVSALADEFQVSFVAATIRFVKLCPERTCVVFARDSRVEWVAYGPDFRGDRSLWVERGPKLDTYTLAHDYFAKGSVGNRPESVSASAWLEGNDFTDDHVLIEHCRPIPVLRATLSLLWIQPDAEY